MTWFEISALALAMAMDAFSVSVSCGMNDNCTVKNAALTAFLFGAFQFIMPLAGNGAALFFADHTRRFAPYIVFVILSALGIKMIADSRGEAELPSDPFKLPVLLMLAFATSVDALAAGVSIGASGAPILPAATVTGIVAAALSAVGLRLGRLTKRLLPFPAEIAGGAVLIAIALKSLIGALI